MADEGDTTFWKGAVFAVVVTAGIITAVLVGSSHGKAAGFRKAWISGNHLVLDEYRMDEGDEIDRVATYDLKSGRRVAFEHYDRQYRALGLATDGRFWIASTGRTPGLQAFTVPELEHAVHASDIHGPFAEGAICFDAGRAKVRERLLDGRYTVVDLRTNALGEDEALDCNDDGRVRSNTASPWPVVPPPSGGNGSAGQTFLSSRPVTGCAAAAGLVLHVASLASDAEEQLSRLGTQKAEWTVTLGAFGTVEQTICLAPSTAVLVGSKGVVVIDVADGAVRWKL